MPRRHGARGGRRSRSPAACRRRSSRTAPAPAARRARSPRRPSAAGRRRARRNASVSASRIRRTSSSSCCSSATMSLLISTVLSGSRKRLAPLAGAAVDDARDRRPVLGADDEHVAAVAVGDDLLLQVLRRVLAAQVRLERAAQPRPLLAQPIAHAPQLRARIVDDLAAGVDLAADVGDLRLEGGGACRQSRAGSDRRSGRAARPRTWPRRRPGTSPSARSCSGSSARPSTASAARMASRSAGACRRDLVFAEEADGLGRRRERRGDRVRHRSPAAARRAAPRPAASARSGGRPRQCDRIRGPSGHRHAWGVIKE